MNLGVNQVCVDLGLEDGCLPFIETQANPVDDLIEIRQAFQASNSHEFESEFNIVNSSLENIEEENDSTDLDNIVSGTAKGKVNSQGADLLIALDVPESDEDNLYSQFAQDLITASYRDDRLYLSSEGFGYQDGTVEVVEKDVLLSLEFLSTTSGGITNISQENQGELSKYEIIVDPSSISAGPLGQASSLKITLYSNNNNDLPEEIGLEGEFSNGQLSYKKRYLNYNEVEDLEYNLSSDHRISSTELLELVSNMEKTKTERDKIRKEDLTQIQSALEAYRQENDQYPPADELDKITDENSGVANVLVPTHISEIPKNPLFDRYYYGYQTTEDGYSLSSVIENEKDPDATEVNGFYLYFLDSTQ